MHARTFRNGHDVLVSLARRLFSRVSRCRRLASVSVGGCLASVLVPGISVHGTVGYPVQDRPVASRLRGSIISGFSLDILLTMIPYVPH